MGLLTKAKTDDEKSPIKMDGSTVDTLLNQNNEYHFDHDKTNSQKLMDGNFYYGVTKKIKLYNHSDIKDDDTKVIATLTPKNKPKLVVLKRHLHFVEVYDCQSQQVGYIVKKMDNLVNYYPRANEVIKTKQPITLYSDTKLYHRSKKISKHHKLKVEQVINDEHGALIAQFDDNLYGLCNCYEVKIYA